MCEVVPYTPSIMSDYVPDDSSLTPTRRKPYDHHHHDAHSHHTTPSSGFDATMGLTPGFGDAFGFSMDMEGYDPTSASSGNGGAGAGATIGPGSGEDDMFEPMPPLTSTSSTSVSGSTSMSSMSASASMSLSLSGYASQTTTTDGDDERTPIVPDDQAPIPASSLPAVPARNLDHHTHSQAHAIDSKVGVLQSPFRATHVEATHGHAMPQTQPQTMMAHEYYAAAAPTQAMPVQMPMMGVGAGMPAGYYAAPHGYQPYYVPDPSMVQQHYMQAYPMVYPGGPMAQPYPAGAYDYRSRQGSPTSSSSVASLTRSASTSSDARHMRPKVKLTHEDKRRIVELHRTNSSLRQEDIAKQYGVDRSTISKIILASHRWTAPLEPSAPPLPKPPKVVGGRFPAIDQKMHDWMDKQIAQGMDVRDQVARDQAKAFAREIGFPVERFKASAKWLDKFKDRRKAAGKPTTSMHYGYVYPYGAAGSMSTTSSGPIGSAHDGGSMPEGSGSLSRTQSTATLSSDSSEFTHISPTAVPAERMMTMAYTRSETDLAYNPAYAAAAPMALDTTPTSRQRSQSSPQIEPGMLSPSSGKVIKPSPLALQRQNSYHGSLPSPRRPAPLSRANTSTLPIRRNRPGSLAASAFFGMSPMAADDSLASPKSPSVSSTGAGGGLSRNGSMSHSHSHSHSLSQSHTYTQTHSRARSDASTSGSSMGMALTPFTAQMGVMAISPEVDTSQGTPGTSHSLSSGSAQSHQMPMPLAVPPLTPSTPGGAPGGRATFNPADYVVPEETSPAGVLAAQHAAAHAHGQMGQHHHQTHQYQQYGTMPNKHYAAHQYAAYTVAQPATMAYPPHDPHASHVAQVQAQAQAQAQQLDYGAQQQYAAQWSPHVGVAQQAQPAPLPSHQNHAHIHHPHPHPHPHSHSHTHPQAVMTDFGPQPGQQYQEWQR